MTKIELNRLQNFIFDKCEAFVENHHKIIQAGAISILQSETWRRLPISQSYKFDFIEKGNIKSIHRIVRVMKGYSFKEVELNDDVRDVFEHTLSTFRTDNPFQIEDNLERGRSASYFRKFNKKYKMIKLNNESDVSCNSEMEGRIDQTSDQLNILSIFNQASYPKQQIVLSSSSQKMFDSFGDYLHLIDAVRPATPQIVQLMKQNVNYSICFMMNSFLSTATLSKISEELSLSGVTKLDDANLLEHNISRFATLSTAQKLQRSHQHIVQLYLHNNQPCFATLKKLIPPSMLNQKQFKGISERVIAIESLEYLLFVFNQLWPVIQCMYGTSCEEFALDNFESIKNELKNIIFMDFAPQFARSDQIFSTIPNNKWEILQLESGYVSNYAERFSQIIGDYKEQLSSAGGGSIPNDVQDEIFTLIIDYSYEQLIEQYSKIRKINENGRIQILRDFQVIHKRVSSFSTNLSREQVQRAFVEDYIAISKSNDFDEVQAFVTFNKIQIILEQERYSLESLLGLVRISGAGSSLTRFKQKDAVVGILNDYKKYFIQNNIHVPL